MAAINWYTPRQWSGTLIPRLPAVRRVACTVVRLVTLDWTRGAINRLSRWKQYGWRRQYECSRVISEMNRISALIGWTDRWAWKELKASAAAAAAAAEAASLVVRPPCSSSLLALNAYIISHERSVSVDEQVLVGRPHGRTGSDPAWKLLLLLLRHSDLDPADGRTSVTAITDISLSRAGGRIAVDQFHAAWIVYRVSHSYCLLSFN